MCALVQRMLRSMSVWSFVKGEVVVEVYLGLVVGFVVGQCFGLMLMIRVAFERRIGGSLGNMPYVSNRN